MPRINYVSGPRLVSFNTRILVDGMVCSWLGSNFSSATYGIPNDTSCGFIAEEGNIYDIILSFNNNPAEVSHWVDTGEPFLTYIEI